MVELFDAIFLCSSLLEGVLGSAPTLFPAVLLLSWPAAGSLEALESEDDAPCSVVPEIKLNSN